MLTKEQISQAETYHRVLRTISRNNPDLRATKQSLLFTGRLLWDVSYKTTGDDMTATNLLFQAVDKGIASGDDPWRLLAQELLVPSQQLAHILSARWCDQGFPQIVIGHKYAAALLATQLSKDVVQRVQPPWRAFFIELPSGLLQIRDDTNNKDVDLTGVLVGQLDNTAGDPRWGFFAITETQVTLWKHGATAEQLLLGDIENVYENASFLLPFSSLDERCNALLGRLILNVCLAMSDPDNVTPPKEDKKGKRAKGGNKRKEKEPTVRTYKLGATPQVDCRAQVREYLQTGKISGTVTVQSMVSGHWKHQAYGPQRSLRKNIWVSPYWRGPEDAPILVKPKVLKERIVHE